MIRPKSLRDLSLAPVAAQIDQNLQRVRELSPEDLIYELALELDRPAPATRAERRSYVLRQALRGVDLRGWEADLSVDAAGVVLRGGSVSIEIALGPALRQFVLGGAPVREEAAAAA